jgi:flagellar export protein FliJ
VTGPSFRFRLERVRAVRERKEKLAQQELARSLSRLSSSQAGLQCAEAELQSAQAEQRTAPQNTLGAVELQSRQAFLERVEAHRSHQVLETQRSEADVAARNAELLKAAGEHEMLNRLRERRRLEHNRDAALRESKVMDEMAISRVRRRTA